jgi:predicted ferric reductase
MRPEEHKHDRTTSKDDPLCARSTVPAMPARHIDWEGDRPPALALRTLAVVLLSIGAGVLAAAIVLPIWLPGLSASLRGPELKVFWYLSRASALVAYGLLWLSMLCGLLLTNRLAQVWPGGRAAFEVHQHASLLGLGFALLHALLLLGDRYIEATPAHILVPFGYTHYATVWVGLGQIGLYGLAAIGLSFYIKPWIGRRLWRGVHFLSFAVFVLALLHSITSGSDSGSPWAQRMYWVSGASVLFLTIYRVLVSAGDGKRRAMSASQQSVTSPKVQSNVGTFHTPDSAVS